MKLKFKHQSYQDDAVNSIVRCFEGQPMGSRRDLLARYKTGQEGSNVINLVNKLDLLIKDLHNFGEKNAYAYIANFISKNWENKNEKTS